MLVPTAELVSAAAARRVGICAFNVITVEHAEAIAAGAERAGQPVILQISENAVRFHGGRLTPIAAATRAIAQLAGAATALHLDHITSDELLHLAPEHGFGSVMYDASARPYDDNVSATRLAATFAHTNGLWVEGELGQVGGKDGRLSLDAHAAEARTDPAEAASYVAATSVDGLAVAVGSSHAMTTRSAALDHELIAHLRAALPVPLVLHGSSGVPDDELVRAVRAGIVKVNIGTALNLAFTGTVADQLHRSPASIDPRIYLTVARDAMAECVARFVSLLAS
jgi:fructose-bisphosphate aldolase, class II